MRRKKINGLDAVLPVLALFMALGAAFVFGPCTARMADGNYMHCHKAGVCLIWLGAGLSVLALSRMLAGAGVKRVLSGAMLAVSVIYALTPGTLIGLCSHADARCQLYTRPAALALGILMAVLSLCALLIRGRKQGGAL